MLFPNSSALSFSVGESSQLNTAGRDACDFVDYSFFSYICLAMLIVSFLVLATMQLSSYLHLIMGEVGSFIPIQ